MQTTPMATATPRTAHCARCSRGASEAHTRNTVRYASSRPNSTSARPGACDHSADSSVHAPNRAKAPIATALHGLTPANGRPIVVTRRARAIIPMPAIGAQLDGL